jgi:sugar (pentulose or hexulose) kinase
MLVCAIVTLVIDQENDTTMGGELLLAIDNGTQSMRVLVFDPHGALVDRVKLPLIPYVSPQPGWAEQEPDYYWTQLCAACQQLWQQGVVQPAAVAAVALTTQRSTVVNVDRTGRPLRPAIHWMDQRRTVGLTPVGGLWGLAFRLRGVTDLVANLQAEAEANWIRVHQPEIWRKTHKLLLLSGYLTFKLCGLYVDSVGCQVGYIPFDYKRLAWAKRRDWKWQAVPMDRAQLPELVPPGGQLGEISRAAASATGLAAGTPLIAAAADKACEVLGSGALAPNIGCISFGSAATINQVRRKYVEVHPPVPPYPAAVPNAYNLEVQIFRGFWLVNWFKEQFGQPEMVEALLNGQAPEALLDDLLQATPPGAMGLMLQPYWSPGVRVPGPEAKGAVIGFGDVHSRAHLYRALLEGLTYALREGGEQLEKRTGTQISELRVAGGGSQSDGAMQIVADIFGLPAARPHVYETSGLGAAIDAAVGVGLHRDFGAAIATMAHVGDVFDPNPLHRGLYEQLYGRVYRRMYEQLQPLYAEIRAITGYPK